MHKVYGKLQVFFENPFWVGIFERIDDGKLSVCKVTFGAEPKDYEIQAFILKNYYSLKFSPVVENNQMLKDHVNPKRMQREIKKQIHNVGIGTKSQKALKLQQEEGKTARRIRRKQQKEEELEQKFELKQQKRREKHKGR